MLLRLPICCICIVFLSFCCSRPDTRLVVLRGITMFRFMVNVVLTLWFAILCVVYRLQYVWHTSESINVSNPGRQGLGSA